jgi:uncharacterized protein (DUF1810 family)
MTHSIMQPTTRPVGRFLDAQRVIYPRILNELRQGRKRTHWMWFVFPQLGVLGKSETARYYGLADRHEALTYLNHPVLRMRLAECTMAVLGHDRLMFSHPDNHKLRSSMTLFSQVAADATLPNAVLAKFFAGPDPLTLDALAGKPIVLPQSGLRPSQAQLEEEFEPWDRNRVARFIKGFGLSPAGERLMLGAWLTDQDRSYDAGWNARADEEANIRRQEEKA